MTLSLGTEASWGFSEPRFFDATFHTASIEHPGPHPDAIICRLPLPSRTTEIQAAESPEKSGRFTHQGRCDLWIRDRRFESFRPSQRFGMQGAFHVC